MVARELRAELIADAAPTLLRARPSVPVLLRRECCALVRSLARLARRLLGAGALLDLFGGEGALR